MKKFIRWVAVIIFKDMALRVLATISAIGLLVIAQLVCPDFFDMLFIPILIGIPLIIATLIYKMPKDR